MCCGYLHYNVGSCIITSRRCVFECLQFSANGDIYRDANKSPEIPSAPTSLQSCRFDGKAGIRLKTRFWNLQSMNVLAHHRRRRTAESKLNTVDARTDTRSNVRGPLCVAVKYSNRARALMNRFLRSSSQDIWKSSTAPFSDYFTLDCSTLYFFGFRAEHDLDAEVFVIIVFTTLQVL